MPCSPNQTHTTSTPISNLGLRILLCIKKEIPNNLILSKQKNTQLNLGNFPSKNTSQPSKLDKKEKFEKKKKRKGKNRKK